MKRAVLAVALGVIAARALRRFLADPWVSWGRLDTEADAFDRGPLDWPASGSVLRMESPPLDLGIVRDAPTFDPFAES